MRLTKWLREALLPLFQKFTRRTSPSAPPVKSSSHHIDKKVYREKLKKGRDTLREDIVHDIINNNSPKSHYLSERYPEVIRQETLQIEFIRAFTAICVVCIIGTWLEPETMSPYLDKLFTLIVFLMGYFFKFPYK